MFNQPINNTLEIVVEKPTTTGGVESDSPWQNSVVPTWHSVEARSGSCKKQHPLATLGNSDSFFKHIVLVKSEFNLGSRKVEEYSTGFLIDSHIVLTTAHGVIRKYGLS